MSRLPEAYHTVTQNSIKQYLNQNSTKPQSRLSHLFGCLQSNHDLDIRYLTKPTEAEKAGFALAISEAVLVELNDVLKNVTKRHQEASQPIIRSAHQPIRDVRINNAVKIVGFMALVCISALSLYELIEAPRRFGNCPTSDGENRHWHNAKNFDDSTPPDPCHTLGFLGLLIPAIIVTLSVVGYYTVANLQKIPTVPQPNLPALANTPLLPAETAKMIQVLHLLGQQVQAPTLSDVTTAIKFFEKIVDNDQRYQWLEAQRLEAEQSIRKHLILHDDAQQELTALQNERSELDAPLLDYADPSTATRVFYDGNAQALDQKAAQLQEKIVQLQRDIAACIAVMHQRNNQVVRLYNEMSSLEVQMKTACNNLVAHGQVGSHLSNPPSLARVVCSM